MDDMRMIKKATAVCLKSACIAILGALLYAFLSAGVVHAEIFDSEQIADAIRIIEGGDKAKSPYGVLSVICRSEAECRRICINTIQNNFTRWQLAGSKGDFLEFLASRYAPTIGATNDPRGLNVNWLKNLRYYLGKSQ